LIASDVLKLVKAYFKDARFIDQLEEVMRHAWWALHPDGLGYHAKLAPIGVKDIRSIDYIVSDRHSLVSLVNNSFQHPEGRFWSTFITPVAKKFLALVEGSAILPPIGPHNPPIGLYILILTAVSHKCRKSLVLAWMLNVYSQVEHASMSFRDGTFRAPLQFLSECTWQAIELFHKLLASLQPKQWGCVLDSLGPQGEQYHNHVDQDDYEILSAYRGSLANFRSPLKGQL
jgi:hypothetical protein